jgi:hypothetical protein
VLNRSSEDVAHIQEQAKESLKAVMTAFVAAHAAPRPGADAKEALTNSADVRSLRKRIQARQAIVDKGIAAGDKVQLTAVEAGTDLVKLLKQMFDSQKDAKSGQVRKLPA